MNTYFLYQFFLDVPRKWMKEFSSLKKKSQYDWWMHAVLRNRKMCLRSWLLLENCLEVYNYYLSITNITNYNNWCLLIAVFRYLLKHCSGEWTNFNYAKELKKLLGHFSRDLFAYIYKILYMNNVTLNLWSNSICVSLAKTIYR